MTQHHLTLVSEPDAVAIGDLYRRAHRSVVDSVRCLVEAGQRLQRKKKELPHGAWLPWLAANAEVLGFESRFTAAKLMRAAKCVAGGTFDENKAMEVCRMIWGHTPLDDDETLRCAVEIRRDRNADKYAERVQNMLEIRDGNVALGVDKKYPIILADPPWRFDVPSSFSRTPENHYPCMHLEEIMALPVDNIATDDAALFLWTTSAHLSVALQVIEGWGFAYKSNLVWDKDKIGLGHYFRNQHETLLLASRGEMPPPLPENRQSSVIRAPRGAHSEKPAAVYQLIERMYPGLTRIELFARQQQPGWNVWGNQIKTKEK
jgi:N6-adenosine-specific RNA methylase IME4